MSVSGLCRNEARGGFKIAYSFSLRSSLLGPFISATNPPFADSQGKVNRGNSAVVAVQQCMLGNTSDTGYCNSSHMGTSADFRIPKEMAMQLRWTALNIFLSPIEGLDKKKMEITIVHDFHALVVSFLFVKKDCCTSVERGNLFDLLTGAMKIIQHCIAVNEITSEFI